MPPGEQFLDIPYRNRAYRVYFPEDNGFGFRREMRRLATEIFGEEAYAAIGTVPPGTLVVDGGAHCGMFTFYALAHGADRVLAVEPNPHLRYFLHHTMQGYPVLHIERALWDQPTVKHKRLHLCMSHETSPAAYITPKGTPFHRYVIGETLDALVRDIPYPVSVIKLDVEGSECAALRGAKETILRDHPKLLISLYHKPNDFPEVVQTLHDMGAKYDHITVLHRKFSLGVWS